MLGARNFKNYNCLGLLKLSRQMSTIPGYKPMSEKAQEEAKEYYDQVFSEPNIPNSFLYSGLLSIGPTVLGTGTFLLGVYIQSPYIIQEFPTILKSLAIYSSLTSTYWSSLFWGSALVQQENQMLFLKASLIPLVNIINMTSIAILPCQHYMIQNFIAYIGFVWLAQAGWGVRLSKKKILPLWFQNFSILLGVSNMSALLVLLYITFKNKKLREEFVSFGTEEKGDSISENP